MSLIDKIIWQIEMRLHDPLTLDQLAMCCAVSPYHMARVFRAGTGLAPMTYLRARRLSWAAHKLASGQADVLTIALEAQYSSHEAFTRAFAAYFGVLPTTVRKAGSTQSLILMEPMKMQKEMLVDVPAPEMKESPAIRIAGLSLQCRFEDNSGIPALWQQFNARAHELGDGPAYGVCYDADKAGRFSYMAGGLLAAGKAVPQGMEQLTLPAGRYAVYSHVGHISDLPKTVYTIWNKALPDSGLNMRKAPDFELYDQRFDVATGRGTVTVWMPVE